VIVTCHSMRKLPGPALVRGIHPIWILNINSYRYLLDVSVSVSVKELNVTVPQ